MTRFALFGLICLMTPAAISAAEPIVGSGEDDTIIGTASDDEIHGGAGDDVIQGNAGDDVIVGGLGTDILWGGPGSDQFIIDFISEHADEVADFRPEDGDTILLRFRHAPQSRLRLPDIRIKDIEIDYDGDVTMQLLNEDQFEVVKLRRSDLRLEVDDLGGDIRLIFTKKFER